MALGWKPGPDAADATPEERQRRRRSGREAPAAPFTSASISAIFAKVPLMVAEGLRPHRPPHWLGPPSRARRAAGHRCSAQARDLLLSRHGFARSPSRRSPGSAVSAFSGDSSQSRQPARCHRARSRGDQSGRSGQLPGARRGSRAARPHPAGPALALSVPVHSVHLNPAPIRVRGDIWEPPFFIRTDGPVTSASWVVERLRRVGWGTIFEGSFVNQEP